MKDIDVSKVHYHCHFQPTNKNPSRSIEVIGLDTEADTKGRCFMLSTSLGHTFPIHDYPLCLFSRKYRNKNFVCYNLKYDEGALLQILSKKQLRELWETQKVKHGKYIFKIIPSKCLTIQCKKNCIHIYDMYNFYTHSLAYNSEKYLGMKKFESDVTRYTKEYIKKHWQEIADYCVQDAVLVKKLADLLIKKFEDFGVFPQKLYSVAYMSYQYFLQNTQYVTMRDIWKTNKPCIDFAMKSYNGGKFEVTEKGCDYYYEYDIVSAYPYEIANLVDITNCRIVYSKKYRRYAQYGFLKCRMKIPVNVFSPIAIKSNDVNTYPVGEIEKVITLNEYKYLLSQGCDITIIGAAWIHIDQKTYPYRHEINKLTELKKKYKQENNSLDYHTIKIFLNSLYGKFVQLIKKKDFWQAGTSWNCIYGSIITANCRIRVSEMQAKYPSIVAVHTDSIISTKPLNIPKTNMLGNFSYECEGEGVILGSGIYQIGSKVKFRGFRLKKSLFDIIDQDRQSIKLSNIRAISWKEVAFHNWNISNINQFKNLERNIHINFDQKRLWRKDWKKFSDIRKLKVYSTPLYNTFCGI